MTAQPALSACPECGSLRHSWLRYAKGWVSFQIVMLWPVRFMPFWLLPSAGDYIYDRRGCQHEGAG